MMGGKTQMDAQKFLALSAGYDGTAWAVDATGTLCESSLERIGDQPQRVWVSQPYETPWAQVAAGGARSAWCIDTRGNVFRVASGATGLQVTAVGGGPFSRISVGADGATWGIDAAGKAFVHDAAQGVWREQPQPQPFSRISVGDASHVMAIGTDGTAYTLLGGAWSGIIGQSFSDVSVASDGSAWAVGQKGNLYFRIGDTWHDTGALFQSISAGSLSNVLGLDSLGNTVDLTGGRTVTLGEGLNRPDKAPRFDTEDPFDETKSTHLWIVNRGILLASDPFGAEFRELFQPDVAQREAGGNPFHRGLCQGLYDADFLDFFNGPAEVGQPTYASHFYDPDTGTNWWGRGTLTALQRGRDLFQAALLDYQAGKVAAAGYALGVSLHYLTDLGQPMHATNFTNVSVPLFWHGGFETIVLHIQNQCSVPTTQTADDATIVPDDYFIGLARKSKQLFQHRFAYGIGNATSCDLGGLGHRPGSEQLAGVQTILQPMLTNAIQTVAHYVAAWFERAEKGFPSGKNAMTLVCAGQQGLAWRGVLWSVDTEGTLWYSYLDVTQRGVLPVGAWSAWQQAASSAPRSPTQLSSCIIPNSDGGIGTQFALANGVAYWTTQQSPSGGWGAWDKLPSTQKLALLCACPYTMNRGQKRTTGASVWGVGSDGVLRYSYQQTKSGQPVFQPLDCVWSDWQQSISAPKNVTALAATGSSGSGSGMIFAVADGALYKTSQLDPAGGGGWAAWAPLQIPGDTPVKPQFVAACQAGSSGEVSQIWVVDALGIVRSATFDKSTGQWSAWSREWGTGAPRNATALTVSTMAPGSSYMQLWALAGGRLYSIEQKLDAQTKQLYWTDWSAAPRSDTRPPVTPPPITMKFTLPIGPLSLRLNGQEVDFTIEVQADPNQSGQGASAVRDVLVSTVDPRTPLHGKMNLVTGEVYNVVNWQGILMLQGQFIDQTHGSGSAYDLEGGKWVTLNWMAAP